MASSDDPGSPKRSGTSHGDIKDEPDPEDPMSCDTYAQELEKICKSHIKYLRLSNKEPLLDAGRFVGFDWLKDDRWPLAIQRRAHQYMHVTDLYQVVSLDEPIFVQFVALLRCQAGLPTTREWQQIAPEICRRWIATWTEIWEGYGLVVTCNKVTRKADLFQRVWNCAIKGIRLSYPASSSVGEISPRDAPRSAAGEVDLITEVAQSSERSLPEKRSAETIQSPGSAGPAKRPCILQSSAYKDGKKLSTVVNSNVSSTSPKRDLVNENIANIPGGPASAPATDCSHNVFDIPTRVWNGSESIIGTVQEAGTKIDTAGKGRSFSPGGVQVSPKTTSLGFTADLTEDMDTDDSSTHGDFMIESRSWGPIHANPITSQEQVGSTGAHGQVASLKTMTSPNTEQEQSFPAKHLPPGLRTSNNDVMITSSDSTDYTRPANLFSEPREVLMNPMESNQIPRSMSTLRASTPVSTEARMNDEISGPKDPTQLFQTSYSAIHQQITPDRAESSYSDSSRKDGTGTGELEIILQNWSPSASSEDSGSSSCLERPVNTDQFAPHPPNPFQNERDSQVTSENYLHQSLNTAGGIRPQTSPIGVTNQDRESQSTSLRQPAGQQPTQGLRPIFPPVPPIHTTTSHPNMMTTDAPAPPSRHTRDGFHSSPDPSAIPPQHRWPPDHPPPPNPLRAFHHHQIPPRPDLKTSRYQEPLLSYPIQSQNPPLSPSQDLASSFPAPTNYQSPYVTDAVDSITRSPSYQPHTPKQRTYSSPGHSGQSIEYPTPAPAPPMDPPIGPNLAQSASASSATFPDPTTSVPDPADAMMWKYREMVVIHVPTSLQYRPNINTRSEGQKTRVFPSDVLQQTVLELFTWISRLFETVTPSILLFDFRPSNSDSETRMFVHQGDSIAFQAVKHRTWAFFQEISYLEPAIAIVRMLITPLFTVDYGNGLDYAPQPSQPLHTTNTASFVPSALPPRLPLPNQRDTINVSDATHCSTQPGLAGFSHPGQSSHSQTGFTEQTVPETISPRMISPKPIPIPISMPYGAVTVATNNAIANQNTGDGNALSNPDPRRLSQQQKREQQPVQNPPPKSTKTEHGESTAKVVIRIQTDVHGRLSRRYDNSALETRTTSGSFFRWFEQETGHPRSGKLRFDFKDAIPAKVSVVDEDNHDHFELMVCDIKRKFERAKSFAPDLNEFCIVVTDPEWKSEDEGDEI